MAHRWAVVALCVVVIISIVPLFMVIGKNFLPVDDQSQFEISFRAPGRFDARRHVDHRRAHRRRICANSQASPTRLSTIGGGQQQLVNNASIYIKLADIESATSRRKS